LRGYGVIENLPQEWLIARRFEGLILDSQSLFLSDGRYCDLPAEKIKGRSKSKCAVGPAESLLIGATILIRIGQRLNSWRLDIGVRRLKLQTVPFRFEFG